MIGVTILFGVLSVVGLALVIALLDRLLRAIVQLTAVVAAKNGVVEVEMPGSTENGHHTDVILSEDDELFGRHRRPEQRG